MSVQVIIVEKGNYTRAADLSLLERDAFQGMYEGGGLATTDNAGAPFLLASKVPRTLSELAFTVLSICKLCREWLSLLWTDLFCILTGINILAGATLGGGTRINWCVLPSWVAVLPAHCRILSIAATIAIGRSLWVIALSMDSTADMHLPDSFFYGRAQYLHLCNALQERKLSNPCACKAGMG